MWYLVQIGKALSRMLNAVLGGEGDTTFSAYSYHLSINGKRKSSKVYGKARVAIVDALTYKGHCSDAFKWHHERDLFEIDK